MRLRRKDCERTCVFHGQQRKRMSGLLTAGVKRELLVCYLGSMLGSYSILWSHRHETKELPGERECKEQCQVHAGEEDHARPG